MLPPEIITAVRPALRQFEKDLPPGYSLEIAGEHKEQVNLPGPRQKDLKRA